MLARFALTVTALVSPTRKIGGAASHIHGAADSEKATAKETGCTVLPDVVKSSRPSI